MYCTELAVLFVEAIQACACTRRQLMLRGDVREARFPLFRANFHLSVLEASSAATLVQRAYHSDWGGGRRGELKIRDKRLPLGPVRSRVADGRSRMWHPALLSQPESNVRASRSQLAGLVSSTEL